MTRNPRRVCAGRDYSHIKGGRGISQLLLGLGPIGCLLRFWPERSAAAAAGY